MSLPDTFAHLLKQYEVDPSRTTILWKEIADNYSKSGRHYHTLAHLEFLLQQLEEVKPSISDWNTILFTLFYHDVIYNVLKSDNEERSADLAAQRMKEIGIPSGIVEHTYNQILATKQHTASPDQDTNYFLDVDLAVLGQSWPAYQQYSQQIRKEYRIYPDLVYMPGRKKVLQHFLSMPHIYKTEHFFALYESPAKRNMEQELSSL